MIRSCKASANESPGIRLPDGRPRTAVAKEEVLMKLGFSSEQYLEMQSRKIRERIKKFGGKLYLEFGGKLFDD